MPPPINEPTPKDVNKPIIPTVASEAPKLLKQLSFALLNWV